MSILRASAADGRLTPVFEALNSLGRTAWAVNKPVLDVAIEAWNSDTALPCLRSQQEYKDYQIPEIPPYKQDAQEHSRSKRLRAAAVEKRDAIFSERCEANYKLEIANAVSALVSISFVKG